VEMQLEAKGVTITLDDDLMLTSHAN